MRVKVYALLAALLMAISYVGGAAASSAGNTDVSVDLTALTGGSDSAPSEGDLVIFAFNIADADNADLNLVCNTSGFATQEIADLFGNGTQDANLGVFWKIMGPTPDAAVVGEGSTGGTDTAILAAAMVFRGVDPASPFDVAATTATGTTGGLPDPPSIDTTGAAGIWTVIVGANAHAAGAGGAFTGPANYTTDFLTIGNVDDTADGIIGMGYNPSPSDPENPGAFADNVAATGWCAVTMALKPAPAVATGSLAATEATDTAAGAGDVLVEGGLAATEAADVAAMAGDVIVEGAIAVSEASDVAAVAGDVIVAGDMAAAEAADVFAAAGVVEDSGISGDLTVTETSDAAALAGTVLVSGAVAATEAADAMAATGDLLVSGTLAATEAQDTAAVAGAVLVEGTLAVSEGSPDTAAAVGTVLVAGDLTVTEGADIALFTSATVSTGDLAAVEAPDGCSAVGVVLVAGNLSAGEAADVAAAVGKVIVSATLAAIEASDAFMATGDVLISGILTASEAADVLAALATEPVLGRQIDLSAARASQIHTASIDIDALTASAPSYNLRASST